ncbi:iron-containing alcohol dehydrogenase [Desulfovibrio sulfodismutans]|uniref:Iron-containing alcohol dehydrogenase n=1 Tax=Desulfolutivibrio sulfodismutans TaxID=63561 RepID=A0A7K3NRV2_9BACT|nr:iron-containing alcohol dehydrogenase [Desulfolutivibrio sulfodismutans]NDY58563.1 iron-containing alcohol dehydrogenase [Desulfolutivibrio sulfodismutans]QLA13929.1 iron-containing alcohol dehydrogenase [Desulfolutivibrio sulfodismutans DSM 3696]
MRFTFAGPGRIVFGPGVVSELPGIVAGFGERVLLVTGGHPGRVQAVVDGLGAAGLCVTAYAVTGEPTVAMAEAGARLARAEGCQVVVSVGGGSVMDAGKAVAALTTNPGDPYDYLEVVGRGLPLKHAPLPHVAAPTTAGTGAEATANAVLLSPEHQVKVSLRSPGMLPDVALADPELTYGLPPEITAATGLDALTQLLEAFVSGYKNPMTDALCRQGLHCAARSLERAFQNGSDAAAREDMSLAALLSGLALANAKLGAVHGLAAPLGGEFPAPHGFVCARLLPLVMAANVRALGARDPDSAALAAFAEAGRILTGESAGTDAPDAPDAPDVTDAAAGVRWVKGLCDRLGTPPLSEFGMTAAAVPGIAAKGLAASSMRGNPVQLSQGELEAILRAAL